MHESDKDPVLDELRAIRELLTEMKDIMISQFVQQSRALDIMVVDALGREPDAMQEVLENHRQGKIHTSEPRLKNFGAGYDD